MRRFVMWFMVAVVAMLVAAVALVVVFPAARHFGSSLIGRQTVAAEPAPIQGADLAGTGPGTLVSAMTMPEFDRSSEGEGMRAARVVYRSTSGDSGAPTVVSGSVFSPLGTPPAGGWPIVAFGHGSLGIDEPCAPSLSGTLLGTMDIVSKLIQAGYAVAFADYQGLGAPGNHPYLDARTAGLNVIDAVRALHHTFPDMSDKWAMLGGSQGGGAVWAADEQVATYAPDALPVGAVAMAPAADVTGLVDTAQAQSLTREQQAALALIVESLARLHPDLNRADYRHGVAAQKWDVLTACSGAAVHDRKAVIDELGTGDVKPSTPEAADRLRGYLQQWALPQQRLAAPLLVLYGGKDEYIDPAWTTAAIARACEIGGSLSWDLQPDKGHGDVDVSSMFSWLTDRFEGKPAADECT